MEHPIRDDVLVIKVTQKFLEAVPVNFDYILTEIGLKIWIYMIY